MTSITERLSAALGDRYRIERELGEGGMATVYLARDLKHERNVAIKVLKPELAAVLGAERFVQEIKTTAALSHPHILPLFDSGEAGGFLYYVMPYIEGETICEKLDREGQFGIEEGVRIASEVADALDYAHRHGVIHRDIKPENILLHDGRPMVMDFGIALAVSAAAGGRMTETGLSLGTPHYMSPEQATAEKQITGRSDVYSLATVLYEMLAGEPPHGGGSAQVIIMKIITERAQPVGELRRSVPPNVAAALARALEKVPADRFATAKEFASALADRSFRAEGIETATGTTHGADRRLLIGAVAVALVAVLLAIVGWMRPSRQPARPMAFEIGLPSRVANSSYLAASVAVGPHGDAIAYVDTVGGTRQLWLKERGVVEPHIIPGTVGASGPTFSPDGTQVAYLVDGRVLRLRLGGGAATAFTDSPIAGLAGTYGLPGAWLDDGSMVLTTQNQVFYVPPEGGTPQRITTMDSLGFAIHQVSAVPGKRAALLAGCRLVGCATPQVLLARFDPLSIVPLVQGAPNGWALDDGRIVYILANGTRFVAALDVDGGTVGPPTQLAGNVTMGAIGAAFVMGRDGSMLYLTGGAPPPSSSVELVRVGRDHPPVVIPGSAGLEMPNNSQIDVSPDGKSVLLSVANGGTSALAQLTGTHVVVFSLASGTSTRLTTDEATNIRANWSPDGRRVLWISNRRNGRYEAWSRAADGAGEPQLLASGPRDIYEVSLSPDGAWLIYRTDDLAAGRGDIYARRVSGDTTVVPIAVSPEEETSPDVSPNGRWIAYAEQIGERKEVVVRSFPDASQSRVQVSSGGGTEPRWSPDGRALVYRKALDHQIVFANVATGDAFRVVGESRISLDSDRYLGNDDTHQWDFMPDGKELLLARLMGDDSTRTPLRMILEEGTIPALRGAN